jgi:predicted nuclease of predicted toxin-antitoxin system
LNLVCDEGVERQIVEHLRVQGHHVVYVAELEPGIPDDMVLSKAVELSAPLITNDKDFGELIFRRQLATAGVILLRLAGLSNQAKAEAVASVVDAHSDELFGAFTVVTRSHVRIRRTSPE